jgi:homocysteine S-methyltransferase
VLANKGPWLDRIRGIRANASTKSHAELDVSTELDIGDIPALARHYRDLQKVLPRLAVMGGCCGTDHRHVAAISQTCLAA